MKTNHKFKSIPQLNNTKIRSKNRSGIDPGHIYNEPPSLGTVVSRSSAGQGLIEYLVIVSLVSMTAFVVMRTLGQTLHFQFARIAKNLGATTGKDSLRAPKIGRSNSPRRSLFNETPNQGSQDRDSVFDGAEELSQDNN